MAGITLTPAELQKRRVRSFLALAEEEFAVAVEIHEKHGRQAAYFLQQAVEKMLRGVLETQTIPAGPMHSIRGLTDLLPKQHPLAARFLEFDVLSPAATRYRYPSPKGDLSSLDGRLLTGMIADVGMLIEDVAPLLKNFEPES